MTSDGFRMVPNWLAYEHLKERRESGQPWTRVDAWFSMGLDQFRNGELSSERAYSLSTRMWATGARPCLSSPK